MTGIDARDGSFRLAFACSVGAFLIWDLVHYSCDGAGVRLPLAAVVDSPFKLLVVLNSTPYWELFDTITRLNSLNPVVPHLHLLNSLIPRLIDASTPTPWISLL